MTTRDILHWVDKGDRGIDGIDKVRSAVVVVVRSGSAVCGRAGGLPRSRPGTGARRWQNAGGLQGGADRGRGHPAETQRESGSGDPPPKQGNQGPAAVPREQPPPEPGKAPRRSVRDRV